MHFITLMEDKINNDKGHTIKELTRVRVLAKVTICGHKMFVGD